MIEIFFPIEPVAKARARVGKFGGYTPKKTKQFENAVRAYALAKYKGKPLDGPLSLSLVFHVRRGKTVKRMFPTVKPDTDNYIKAVCDSLNQILWTDDSQICDVWACKRYSDHPGVDLCVFQIRDKPENALK